MATMYHLFFGILFIAVCSYLDAIPLAVRMQPSNQELRTMSKGSPITNHESRIAIINIAQKEIGVKEATGNNDGERVEGYLRYTGLGKGYAWCAAFASWCFGQARLPEPRNPWSPALFPNVRTYCKGDACRRPNMLTRIKPADIFGIYGQSARRINHVGLVKNVQSNYLITIEGNSNNRVESKRRHISTIYALADWIETVYK